MELWEATTKNQKVKKLRKRRHLNTNTSDTRVKAFRSLNPLRDTEEIRTLMRRPLESEEEEYRKYPDSKCEICHSSDHFDFECTFLEEIPEGAVIGRRFDKICKTCGTIGSNCSCKIVSGSYAYNKFCPACIGRGHWFWEEDCSRTSPWMPLLLTTDKSVEQSLRREFMSHEDDQECCDDKAESEY